MIALDVNNENILEELYRLAKVFDNKSIFLDETDFLEPTEKEKGFLKDRFKEILDVLVSFVDNDESIKEFINKSVLNIFDVANHPESVISPNEAVGWLKIELGERLKKHQDNKNISKVYYTLFQLTISYYNLVK